MFEYTITSLVPPIKPVSEHKIVYLTQWLVVETNDKSKHFVGFNFQENEWRVSSAIRGFSPKMLIGRTTSGRIYQLVGDKTKNIKDHPTLDAVVQYWMTQCYVDSYIDVTDIMMKIRM